MENKFYLLVIELDVQARLHGPYAAEALLDDAAHTYRREHGPEDDGLHWLIIGQDGIPEVGDWSGAFFEDDEIAYGESFE